MALQDYIAQAKTKKERDTLFLKLSQHREIAERLQTAESLLDLVGRASEIRSLVDADWVFAWAVEDSFMVTRDPAGGEVRVHMDQPDISIAAHVVRTGEVVNIGDVYDAAELQRINPKLKFNRAGDQASGFRTKQMLLAPVLYRNRVLGVLQALNKHTAERFDFLDAESLREVGKNLGPIMHQVVAFERQSRALRYQERLTSIVNAIHAASDVDQILISVAHDIAGLFEAERITIYAVDQETGELYSRVKLADETKEFRVAVSKSSVAGYAAATHAPVVVADVYDSEELARIHPELTFNRSFDEASGFRTRQVMASPVEFQGSCLGVLQLINRVDGQRFDQADQEHAKSISDTIGIAFHNQMRAGAKRTKLDSLVDRKLVSLEQLRQAREKAKEEGASVEMALMTEFRVQKKDILSAYSEFYGVLTYEHSDQAVVPQGLLAQVKDRYDDMKSARWVPVAEKSQKVVVAIDDPKDIVRRDQIQGVFPEKRVEYRVAVPEDIAATIDHFFGVESSGTASVSEILEELQEAAKEVEEEAEAAGEEEASEDDSAVVKLVNRIIEDAAKRGASDIHIEPAPDGDALVRFRVDGALLKVMTFPRSYRQAVISRVKIMSDLDIAERRKPQSGKIKFRKWGKLDIELRVETVPTVGGTEDAVLRILASSKPLPLDKMGMSERNLREFKRIADAPYGIVLCVGPTGSGKTTTLHSALGFINKPDIKIWTAEDPVEITQQGLRQVQMNRKAGLDFATSMRSFLRADPDVIMIGEMRDHETAATGIEASLTGHLVFSTLHTNSAPETITRLIDMGIDPYSFADAMLGVLAQRLARTVCASCKEEYELTDEEIALLRDEHGSPELFDELGAKPGMKLARAREGGCPKCNNTGYRGRLGIHELLVNTDQMKVLVYTKAKAMDIRDLAISQGMRTLKQDGIAKVLKGLTTLEQVRSVCLA